jgi:hypothetical protein
MGKKLFISLAPLLVTVAFAMVPVAQADTPPHWFVGGIRLGEGVEPNPAPTISWGTLELTSEKKAPLHCENVNGGDIENPAPVGPAGPAGVDETESFNPYDCFDEECPASLGLELQVKGEGLPWPSKLTEEVGPPRVIRDVSTEVEVTVICVVKAKYEGYPGLPTLVAPPTACAGPNSGPTKALSNGESDPSLIKGTSATIQSRALFTGEPDHLECGTEAEPNKGTTINSLKTITYNKGALYTAN